MDGVSLLGEIFLIHHLQASYSISDFEQIEELMNVIIAGAGEVGFEVLSRWRTLGLPIMLPGPVSFHAFPHKQPGLHCPAKHCIR